MTGRFDPQTRDSSQDYTDAWMSQMVHQLERTEQATRQRHEEFGRGVLLSLLAHAAGKIPAYRERLKPLIARDGSLSLDDWLEVRPLGRSEAVELGEQLITTDIPEVHGAITDGISSGSTGRPFEFKSTQFHETMWDCITERYHRWHGLDYRKILASIRPFDAGQAAMPDGLEGDDWAPQAMHLADAGAHIKLNINTPVDQQLDWLCAKAPDYLHSFPSNLRALGLELEKRADCELNISGIMTYAEMLTPDTRDVIQRTLGCNPADCYSSRECGYMALQSPASNNYLVQTEVCHVEILDDSNQPCAPGETGRVVATPLHSYAQPLIRYETGDFARVGTDDASGLPFPVLSRIHGRARNLFRFAGGQLVQPDFSSKIIQKYLRPAQWQVAQTGPMEIEIRIVPGMEPGDMDTDGMSAYVRALLGPDLAINYKLVTHLINPRTSKHEDYVCELPER